jgi:hypothetical protein
MASKLKDIGYVVPAHTRASRRRESVAEHELEQLVRIVRGVQEKCREQLLTAGRRTCAVRRPSEMVEPLVQRRWEGKACADLRALAQ